MRARRLFALSVLGTAPGRTRLREVGGWQAGSKLNEGQEKVQRHRCILDRQHEGSADDTSYGFHVTRLKNSKKRLAASRDEIAAAVGENVF
jgi:hypothetical protein